MNTNPKEEVGNYIDTEDDILLEDYRISDYNVGEFDYIDSPILEESGDYK